MEEATSCSCEIVQVAIVNRDTFEDKLKEHITMTVITGVATIAFARGVPWLGNKIGTAIKKRKEAKAQKKD